MYDLDMARFLESDKVS